jgi:hypothetical protein
LDSSRVGNRHSQCRSGDTRERALPWSQKGLYAKVRLTGVGDALDAGGEERRGMEAGAE